MSPQFVDYDSDGDLDIVAATFSGSPYVALAGDAGHATPQMILDREGARIVGHQFWNYETAKWDETRRCDPDGVQLQKSHVTSAWAVDYDRDGDLDLLLGDHDSGYVFLRENEGSATAPAFATKNAVVMVDDAPLLVPGTVTTLRTIDWDRDGRFDLLIGSMGDPYGDREGGGVTLHLDLADDGLPRFGPAITLIERSPKGQSSATRPDSGLYMDAGDLDGDGDLDLVVGGYSIHVPPARTLTEVEEGQLRQLQVQREALEKKLEAAYAQRETQTESSDKAEAEKALAELSVQQRSLSEELRYVVAAIEKLAPSRKRESMTWFYENLRVRSDDDR